jgi:hypothetical protein
MSYVSPCRQASLFETQTENSQILLLLFQIAKHYTSGFKSF